MVKSTPENLILRKVFVRLDVHEGTVSEKSIEIFLSEGVFHVILENWG